MDRNAPKGKLYSDVYLERGAPVVDSIRARKRIGLIFARDFGGYWEKVARNIETRLGHEIGAQRQGIAVAYIQRFIESCSIQDFLDCITLIYSELGGVPLIDEDPEIWRNHCREVFVQENLQYEIDDKCGVHNSVDAEFQHQLASTISGLEQNKYAKAREQLERGLAELRKPTGSRYVALRSLFDAAETVTKEKYGVDRLTRNVALDKVLKAAVAKTTNSAEKTAAEKYSNAFGDWIDALHVYRHSHDEGVPLEPDMEWAIDLFGTGSAFLRWLVRL